MFEKVAVLGKGAYGYVYKVKCLKSTTTSENGTDRVLLTQKGIKQEKNKMSIGGTGVLKPNSNRSLFEGSFYVIKVVDVGILPQEMQLEALNEIDFM
jgi:hypothetical protein